MPHVVTTKSVVISTPVLDSKGKPVTEEVKWGVRKITHNVCENVQHEAGVTLEVSEELAAELIEGGHAREVVVGVDDEVDPTKAVEDVLS